ncbi:alpha/beta hydrolase [Metabacillus sp. GX 13764]|uniref:alpha/beta hydrolase n=1 Tax=Metabacillus kandeliae TaxID=2900151 RepID=UPI001E384ACE|nr:alpha/beta hydrolase [Metabacillus kandeliae]MCD7033271.1 alpha/beta hydrolase [Metabacillus kandeliae]
MKKLLIALGIFLSYVTIVGFFFTSKMMFIKRKTDEEILETETAGGHYNHEEFTKLEKIPVSVPSSFGYDIKGSLIAPYQNKQFIILCHGVTVSRYNSIKYMNLFLKRGWNVLIYDHRRHGESGGKTTSFGHYEKFDLQSVVHWLKKEYGEDLTLGIHGESMGAVTTLLYAGMIEDGADFYIADCPFEDFGRQLAYRLKVEFRLPGALVMPIANVFLKLRDKYLIKDVSPIQVVDRIQHPVLFIHSENDDYIPSESSRLLYEKKLGAKKIFIAEKGSHAMSYAENREEYQRILDEFLSEIQEENKLHSETR